MSDFINKIVTLILIFILLIMAPTLISYQSRDLMGKRLILNDVTNFIDQVQDTSKITMEDLDKLYLSCNSHGLAVDVKVKRLIRTEITKEGVAQTTYFSVDSEEGLASMNPGDTVQVSIKEVAISPARRLAYTILKVDEGPLEFSLAGVVG